MRYLVRRLGGTRAVAPLLRVSRRAAERYVKDQIGKPRPDLAARIDREVKAQWQPQVRARARQSAASTGGIVIDTRARLGYTAPPDAPASRAPCASRPPDRPMQTPVHEPPAAVPASVVGTMGARPPHPGVKRR